MNRSHLIIVHGISATGKTRLATKIAEHFNLPLVSRDSLKEIIFDDLGWSDREWSTKVGKAAYDLLDYFVEQQLKAGNSLIVETPYNPKFENEKFQQWQADYHFNAIQILCYAEGSVVVDRFKKRSNSGERHPGHNDIDSFEEFQEKLLKGKAEYLDLKGSVIEVDTTDFNNIDESSIFEQIDSEFKATGSNSSPVSI